jgi:hypothetical protein
MKTLKKAWIHQCPFMLLTNGMPGISIVYLGGPGSRVVILVTLWSIIPKSNGRISFNVTSSLFPMVISQEHRHGIILADINNSPLINDEGWPILIWSPIPCIVPFGLPLIVVSHHPMLHIMVLTVVELLLLLPLPHLLNL